MPRQIEYRVFMKSTPGWVMSVQVTAGSRKQATARVLESHPYAVHIVTVPERAYMKLCDTKFPGKWPTMAAVKKL